jgi:hypothetical protein
MAAGFKHPSKFKKTDIISFIENGITNCLLEYYDQTSYLIIFFNGILELTTNLKEKPFYSLLTFFSQMKIPERKKLI